MYNRDFVIDSRRPSISLFTVAFWTAALYLGTAYTTLITPTSVLTQDSLSGTEIDFSSQDFWDWYNHVDAQGNYNRTIMGCGWTNYNNTKGSVVYQTCAYDDTISFLTAGQSAAQYQLGAATPVASYLDKRYEGVTGGTLPQGLASWPALTDIEFSHWHQNSRFPSYNYTLRQQGLSADVSCQVTEQGAISSTYTGFVNTTIPGLTDGSMNLINYAWTCPGSNESHNATIISPRAAWTNLQVCEYPANSKEYTIYIGTFGDYANTSFTQSGFFPNLTCTLKPFLTDATVQYRTADSLFRVGEVTPIAGSTNRVPNETYQAIDRAFSLAVTTLDSMIIDSIHGIVAMNSTLNIPEATAMTLKGYIEFYATSLRLYYSANEPPGRRPVTGNFTVWRMGYKGQPIVLASLLPPLVLVCGLAITYVVLGLQTGVGYVSGFNPIDGLPMMVASAAGGRAGVMPLHESLSEKARDAKILRTSVMYDAAAGHLITMSDRGTDEDIELVGVRQNNNPRDQLFDDNIPLVGHSQESPRLDLRIGRKPVFREAVRQI